MTENVRVVDIEVRGVSTVKELKEQIKDLRDRLVRLDETSDDYKKTVDELIADEKKLTEVMKAGKNEVSAATGSYNALVNEMSALKKVWREVTSESERARIGQRISEINTELKKMDASIGNYQRNVGDYENAFKKALLTPQQELRNLRKELANLEVGTEAYNRTFLRMAELTTQVRKQQELLKYSSADLGDILGNLAGVTASVVGGFSAINAAMALMGNEDEDLQKAMLKAQRMIQLVQGLSSLQNLGDKIQGLFNGMKNFVRNFTAGSAAVGEFNKNLEQTEGVTTKVTAEINTQAQTLTTNAVAMDEQAQATERIDIATQNLQESLSELKLRFEEERAAVMSSTAADNEKAKALARLSDEYRRSVTAKQRHFKMHQEETAAINGTTVATKKLTYEAPKVTKEIVKTNNVLKLTKQNFIGAKEGMIQYTAATRAAAVATSVLQTALAALGIGLVIGAITALVGLLGKGLKPLWDWVSGNKAAADTTEKFANATEKLNTYLEERNDYLDFESRLMDAQGKSYEEIYEYKKKNITADLNLAKALLAETEAQAAAIGEKKLAKKKYEEFNNTLKEQRQIVQDLTKDLKTLNQDKIIHDEAEKHKGGGSAYNQQLKEAQTLYKQLQNYYKTDRQKLTETYEHNKALINKYIKNQKERNKALLLLDKKYFDDLKELTRANREAILSIHLNQENRLLALYNVYGEKYLDRALEILKKEQKQAEEQAKARIKDETLLNNELLLINEEYAAKERKLREDAYERTVEEQRNVIKQKIALAKTDKDLLDAEIELAEFNLSEIALYRKEGESVEEYNLRVAELNKTLDELIKRRKELKALQDDSQLKLDNDALQASIEHGQYSIQYYKAAIAAAKNYKENLKQLQDETNEEFRARQLAADKELVDLEAELLQQRLNNWTALANGIADIFGSIADLYEEDIRAQKEADGEYNEESKKKFEYVKGLQIAQATINTISGAIAAFMSAQSLGEPWGAIIGAISAAAVTAAGAAEIVKIKNTKLDSNSSPSTTTYATAIPNVTDYVPNGNINLTGGQETEDLANALTKNPIKAYVVESEVSASQELARQRTAEATF